MGTVFYPSIGDYLKDKPIHYYPFPGHVHSHPSLLDGTIDDIVAHACQLDLMGPMAWIYSRIPIQRRSCTSAEQLLRQRKYLSYLLTYASFERIKEVWDADAWGFTIGSAFFDKSSCRMARLKKTYGQCLIGWNGNKP